MDRSTFESADPVLDEISAKLDELLDSDQFAAIRLALGSSQRNGRSSVFREPERMRRCL